MEKPEPLWSEFTQEELEERWRQINRYSQVSLASWQALINKVSVDMFVEWLREKAISSRELNRVNYPSFWEFVNGTIIELDKTRLLLVTRLYDPEKIDSPFRVPGECVDIPEWASDYYLQVWVNLDENDYFIAVSGYVSHSDIKMIGVYDESDRTYLIRPDDLREDLIEKVGTQQLVPISNAVLSWRERLEKVFDETWQTVAFANSGRSRPFIQPEPMTEKRILELIELLSTSKDKLTRLDAIEWLGRNAKGNQEAIASLVNLRNTSTDEDLRREAAVSLGEIDPGNEQAGVKRAKMIDLGMPQHQLALAITLMPGSDRDKMQIHLRVNSVGEFLPRNLEMNILDEEGNTFDKIMSRTNDNAMQLVLAGEEGDRFTVRIALGSHSFTEDFVL